MLASDVIKTINRQDQLLCLDRNDEITALAEGIFLVNHVLDDEIGIANFIRCALESAYVLGRRDGVNVPDVFKE